MYLEARLDPMMAPKLGFHLLRKALRKLRAIRLPLFHVAQCIF